MSLSAVLRPRHLPLLAAMLAATPALAEDEAVQLDDVVVTATRTKTKADQVGSSVTVVTAEEIEAKQVTKVEDVLREVPGVSITRQGGLGSTSQVRMRGAEPNHTLVLLDGQRVNYQDTIYNFDFDWLQADDIERIEVLRGPAAGQWGSDAVGGVINIITKKGRGPMRVTALGELGSFGTNKENVAARGGGERYDYDFGWSRYRTAGWSTASKERGLGEEKDGSQNNTYHAKLGVSPTDNSEVEARVSHTDMWSELDTSTAGVARDASRAKHKHVDTGSLKGSLAAFDGFWTQTATLSAIHNDQWLDGDYKATGDLYRAYDSTSWTGSWQNDLRFDRDNTTTLGLESTTDRYRQINYDQGGKMTANAAATTNAGFVQHQTRLFDVLDLGGGWRGNDHEVYGWRPTWFGTAAWHLPTDTTLKGSYGTSFKSPLHYQIYYPSGRSNEGLQPEEGRGWDLGVEQGMLGGRAKGGVTWFRNDIDNLIELVGTGTNAQYQNVAKATTYGVESFFRLTVFDDGGESLTLTPSYTYTRAYQRDTHEELARRPLHKAGGDVTWQFLEKRARLNLTTTYSSDFQENRGNTRPDNRHGEYVEFDLAGSYDINDTVQVFGRVENLLDRYHESAWGYAETGGRAFFAGVKLSFEPAKALSGDGK